jgi:hypothetical protein
LRLGTLACVSAPSPGDGGGGLLKSGATSAEGELTWMPFMMRCGLRIPGALVGATFLAFIMDIGPSPPVLEAMGDGVDGPLAGAGKAVAGPTNNGAGIKLGLLSFWEPMTCGALEFSDWLSIALLFVSAVLCGWLAIFSEAAGSLFTAGPKTSDEVSSSFADVGAGEASNILAK